MASFGIYSLVILYPYLFTARAIQNNPFYFTGIISQQGDLHLDTVNNKKIRGKVFLSSNTLSGGMDTAPTRVSLTGTVRWPEDSPRFANYLRNNQYLGSLVIHTLHSREKKPEGTPGFVSGFRSLAEKFYNRIALRWPLSAAFSRALLLGEKRAIPGRILHLFRNLGISHLFVISGLHVGFLYFWLERLIPAFYSPVRFLILAGCLIAYLMLIHWPVSAVRAVIMALMYGFSQLIYRDVNPVSLLAGAVLVLLVFNPFVIYQAGFQLTVSALLGIFAVFPYLSIFSRHYLVQLFLLNLGAFFGVLPVVLYHFHYIPAWGMIFSYVAGLAFPVFLLLLALQNIFMFTVWTFFADWLESFFVMIISGLRYFLIQGDFVFAISGISGITVFILALATWWMFDPTWETSIRFTGIAIVFVVVLLCVLPPVRPHLEQRNVAGVPVTYIQPTDERPFLIIPPRASLDRYVIKRINFYLRTKGIRQLSTVISDLPRRSFKKLGLHLPARRYLVYWRRDDEFTSKHLKYDFKSRTLHSTFAKIRYNNPPQVKLTGYDPEIIAGYSASGDLFVGDLAGIKDNILSRLQANFDKINLLDEKPYISLAAGEKNRKKQVELTVEEQLAHIMHEILKFRA